MLKLLKYLKLQDFLLALLMAGVVVAQVYFEVTMPDYMAKLTALITTAGVKPQYADIFRESGTMLLYAFGAFCCIATVNFIATYISANFSNNLRHKVFDRVTSFSFEELNRFSTPSLITRTTNDIQQVQMTVIMFCRLAFAAPITAIWAIIKINASSNKMMIAIAVCVAFLVVTLLVLIMVVLNKFSLIQKLTDKLNGVSRENLTGLRVVKAFNAEKYQESKFENVNQELSKTYIYTNRILGIVNPIMVLTVNALTLTIYWLGSHLVNLGQFDIPNLFKTTQLAMQVLFSFMMLTMLFIMIPRGEISAKRVAEVLNTQSRIIDPEVEEAFTEQGTVEFKNVSFRYQDAEADILQNISFRANKGETVAFIGSTGSGKSTLINLIPRFYDVSAGEVLVCGVDVRKVKQDSLRKKLGYVPQTGVLFSGTVAENIGYGVENASDDELMEFATTACANDFVSKMEEGINSHISQGGKNVSGGQRQRLSIARALAKQPEILIFDDSFSALDYKTDREVRERIKKQTKGVTCLIVAARIGTIMDADKIVVLESGEMVGVGTHKELLKTCEVYRDIAESQLSKEELER